MRRCLVLLLLVGLVAASACRGLAPARDPAAAYAPLVGRWERPDGGYILEIRGVAADGALQAAYYNPRSINVAKAQATNEAGVIKLHVELRDVNYPGSTYRLKYDPTTECLAGSYFQAMTGEIYDIYFVRLRP